MLPWRKRIVDHHHDQSMPFEPIHERHAIQEVVFVLNMGRPFTPDEIGRVVARHDLWKADLPKLSRPGVFQINLGAGAIAGGSDMALLPFLPFAPAIFEAIKRDGSVDWRLRIDADWIGVNCLTYTRWNEIWPRARALLSQASQLAWGDGNALSGVALQYIDAFKWEGDANAYSVDELLRRDTRYVPSGLRGRGPLWHLHQGWMRHDGLPAPGRLLERVHLDAVEQEGQFLVKMDTTLRLELDPRLASHEEAFGGDRGFVDSVFDELHATDKVLVGSYLTDEMVARIALNA